MLDAGNTAQTSQAEESGPGSQPRPGLVPGPFHLCLLEIAFGFCVDNPCFCVWSGCSVPFPDLISEQHGARMHS